MKVFARDHVQGKSKFWYFMRKLNKVKHNGGEVLTVSELFEKNPNTVKNYGMWIRYKSRSGTHNMYKEFRDLSQTGAVSQMYAEMAGRHRALSSNISIIKIAEIKDSQCKRPHMIQVLRRQKFPLVRRIPLVPKSFRSTFIANRPCTYMK
eukprot:GHVR01137061.1.p1 GENE.GHVR01137061.1~~GHVR01137061.1.p1  ORF type:complete len:150 (+),score=21.63 GHVR01137061.1:205-654(+)